MPDTPLLVAALLLVDSLHFVFARLPLPQVSPGVSAAYVLAVATLEVGLYGPATRRRRRNPQPLTSEPLGRNQTVAVCEGGRYEES